MLLNWMNSRMAAATTSTLRSVDSGSRKMQRHSFARSDIACARCTILDCLETNLCACCNLPFNLLLIKKNKQTRVYRWLDIVWDWFLLLTSQQTLWSENFTQFFDKQFEIIYNNAVISFWFFFSFSHKHLSLFTDLRIFDRFTFPFVRNGVREIDQNRNAFHLWTNKSKR